MGKAEDIVAKLKPVSGRPMAFRTDGLAAPNEVTLAPFYTVHRQRYAVYWRLTNRAAYDAANR